MATDDGASDLDRDLELGGDFAEAVDARITAALKEVHTTTPGIIQSFDPAKMTAVVQPALRRIFVAQGAVPLPQCVDVPVQFPRWGNFILTMPPVAGDECLLAFSERAIDNWFARGDVQDPSEVRFHHLSDAFALCGFSSAPRQISNFFTGGAELRTLDGSTVIRVEAEMVTLGQAAGAEPAVLGTQLMAYLTTLAAAVPSAAPTTAILATKVKVS